MLEYPKSMIKALSKQLKNHFSTLCEHLDNLKEKGILEQKECLHVFWHVTVKELK